MIALSTQIRGAQIRSATIEALRLIATDIDTVGTVSTGTWAATNVAVAHGGTGASNAANARTNLGLAIGSDVQAWNSTLDAVSNGTYSGDDSITTLGTISTGTWQGSQIQAAYLPSLDAITAPAADVSLNSHKITNLLDPVADTDAATKAYVDNSQYLRSVKEPVRVAANSNVTIASPGANVDGVAMSSGDRVLLFGQTTGSQNGIYVWNGAAAAMTRAADADSSAEMGPNHYMWVEEGSFADQAFVCTTNAPITLGTTALAYVKFSGLGQINAGNGLTKTGNTLDVVSANGGIVVNADNIALTLNGATLSVGAGGLKVASSGITSTEIATSAVGTSQIAANAVTEAKIAASVAGDGLSGGNGTALSVNCAGVTAIDSDAVTVQAFGSQVQSFNSTHFANNAGQFKLKADGVSETELNTSVAGNGLSGGGGSALAVNTTGVMNIASDNVVLTHDSSTVSSFNSTHFQNSAGEFKLKASGVNTTELANDSVTSAKIDSSVAGDGLSGGSGSALAVNTTGVIQITADNVVLQHGAATVTSFNSTHFQNSAGEFKLKASGVGTTEIDSSIAGRGLSGGSGAALDINDGDGLGVDNSDNLYVKTNGAIGIDTDSVVLKYNGSVVSSLSTSSFDLDNQNVLRMKASSVSGTELNTSVAGDGLSGGGGSALSVNVAGVMKIAADAVAMQHDSANVDTFNSTHFQNSAGEFKLKASGVNTTELANEAVTAAKLAASAVQSGGGLTGGNGTALALQMSYETPSGSVNGSNTAFTLANTPAGSKVMLFLNGLFLEPGGADYSLSGTSITMATAPVTGDVLRAFYFY